MTLGTRYSLEAHWADTRRTFETRCMKRVWWVFVRLSWEGRDGRPETRDV